MSSHTATQSGPAFQILPHSRHICKYNCGRSLKQLSLKGKVIRQINLKAVKHSRHTLVLHHHAERQQSPGYSPLVVRCVTDAGVEAADMANGDNPNDGPCPFPDVSWLGAGSDAKLPTTTYTSNVKKITQFLTVIREPKTSRKADLWN